MENGSMQLTAVDLLQPAAPVTQLHRNRQSVGASRSSENALRLWANSVGHDQNGEMFAILLLWLCGPWVVGAALVRLFL